MTGFSITSKLLQNVGTKDHLLKKQIKKIFLWVKNFQISFLFFHCVYSNITTLTWKRSPKLRTADRHFIVLMVCVLIC